MAGRQRALVTGASSGIGAAFARRLARDGHDLVLVARRKDRLEALACELRDRHGIGATVRPADLSCGDEVDALAREVAAGSTLDVLVHSAGFGTRALFAELDEGKPRAMNHVHVIAPVQLARSALPRMLDAGRGRLILVSSLGAFFTTARYTTYSATKAYLNMFAEGLQAELDGTGVRVQAICPGLTRTEFLETADYGGFQYQGVPDWVWMTPEQVVEEALASNDAVFVPGFGNRVFVGVLRAPLLGPLVRWSLSVLGKNGMY
jgi:short-subunit dehydrogenase